MSRGAGPQSSGAVQIFVETTQSVIANPDRSLNDSIVRTVQKVPIFLGWGEQAPIPQINPSYAGLKADTRGTMKDHDEVYEGQDGAIEAAALTIWDEDVLQSIERFTLTSAPGVDFPLDIGTLMMSEGRTYQLWMRYPRARTSQYMINANMRGGYHYFAARTGQVRRITGTTPNKVFISWKCLGLPTATSVGAVAGIAGVAAGVGANGLGYITHDFDMSGIANTPVTFNPPLP